MALRAAQTLLGNFQRAGVFCIAATSRGCIVHGLPAVPDTLLFSPINIAALNPCVHGVFIESWDSTVVVIQNSLGGAVGIYLRLAVEHSIIQ